MCAACGFRWGEKGKGRKRRQRGEEREDEEGEEEGVQAPDPGHSFVGAPLVLTHHPQRSERACAESDVSTADSPSKLRSKARGKEGADVLREDDGRV